MFIIIGILPRDELKAFFGMDIGICEWDFALPISSPNHITLHLTAQVQLAKCVCKIKVDRVSVMGVITVEHFVQKTRTKCIVCVPS